MVSVPKLLIKYCTIRFESVIVMLWIPTGRPSFRTSEDTLLYLDCGKSKPHFPVAAHQKPQHCHGRKGLGNAGGNGRSAHPQLQHRDHHRVHKYIQDSSGRQDVER